MSDTEALERAIQITAQLREHCGWTAALTPQSLSPYLVEEAAEVRETIAKGDIGKELADELGDVLFQLLLHAELASERGDFTFSDIADALSDKLLRRNTHVFAPDGSLREEPDTRPGAAEHAWQQAKAAERATEPDRQPDPLHGTPRSLPSLLLAQTALSRAEAARAESPSESTQADEAGAPDAAEIGQALLAQVIEANRAGINAEDALRVALLRHLGAAES